MMEKFLSIEYFIVNAGKRQVNPDILSGLKPKRNPGQVCVP